MNAPNDRDQALERLLRQSLKTPGAGATASCLDPETLAVWADGGLSGDELEIAQSHVADCARCQASLAALVHTSSFESTKAASDAPERTPRRWFPWLVPLTAAAAAIAIWVAVPRGPRNEQRPVAEPQNQSAQLKAPEMPAPANALQEPATTKEEQQAAAKRDQPQRAQAQASALNKDTERRELDQLKQEPQSAGVGADRADKPRSAAEPAPSSAAAAPLPPPPPAARQALQDTAVFKALAVTPRWRIAGTTLEHSDDGGATWIPVATDVTSELTSVSAPSTTVCWVVGRRGVILRTTDGRNFSRVAFPEITDLSAVLASNAQAASVTASDGRVFATTDGGATWR